MRGTLPYGHDGLSALVASVPPLRHAERRADAGCESKGGAMGLVSAAFGAASGVAADQWLEYFNCEALPETVLAVKGRKWVNSRGRSVPGNDNIISNGSKIAVADGQCMIVVEQGRILDVCAEPGEYTFDLGSEPSLFFRDDFED